MECQSYAGRMCRITMKIAPFRAVIFDCDGVLVNSEWLGLRAMQQALKDSGVELPLAALSRFSGRSYGESLAELEAESGVALLSSGVAERTDACYSTLVETEGLSRCPGVSELLGWLSLHDIPFTLASSGPRRKVLISLKWTGLLSAFPCFICADDVSRAKPAADPYLAAAALIGIDPVDCLAVEDSPNGIRSASEAGMQVVAVTTSFASSALTEADLVVESLLQLHDFFADSPDSSNGLRSNGRSKS